MYCFFGMKPFIVLFGDTYYPEGWADYLGEADTLEEAEALATRKGAERIANGWDEFWWWEIVDLRTKQCVKSSSD